MELYLHKGFNKFNIGKERCRHTIGLRFSNDSKLDFSISVVVDRPILQIKKSGEDTHELSSDTRFRVVQYRNE